MKTFPSSVKLAMGWHMLTSALRSKTSRSYPWEQYKPITAVKINSMWLDEPAIGCSRLMRSIINNVGATNNIIIFRGLTDITVLANFKHIRYVVSFW